MWHGKHRKGRQPRLQMDIKDIAGITREIMEYRAQSGSIRARLHPRGDEPRRLTGARTELG